MDEVRGGQFAAISGMLIQPIRYIKEDYRLSRALIFHARIGTLCA